MIHIQLKYRQLTDSTTQIGSLSNVLSRLSVEVRIDGEDETQRN